MSHKQLCQNFWQSRRTLILGSLNEEGVLESSVAPFVRGGAGHLVIFISELAQHTQNILQLIERNRLTAVNTEQNNPPGLVSGLLIADEAQTPQLFARERLTLQLLPEEIVRGSASFRRLMIEFEREFGEVVTMLQTLPDFHLIQLTPVSGSYVKGFGQAFTFGGFPCEDLSPVQMK